MPVQMHNWKEDAVLPEDHSNVIVGAGWGSALLPRDDALELLDLALKVAGYDQRIASIRAAIAEDEDCAVITTSIVDQQPSSGVPRLRSRRARPN